MYFAVAKGKTVEIRTMSGALHRRIHANGEVASAVVNGSGPDATVVINRVDGHFELWTVNAILIRRK